MGTKQTIANTLFGKTRLRVLSLLYGQPDESFYLRQIVRLTGSALGAVQRELRTLTRAGIVRRRCEGRQVFYQADPACPVFGEIKTMLAAAVQVDNRPAGAGISRAERNIRVPREKLVEFCKRHHIARLAFFGSVLRNDFRPESDVDVLVEFEPDRVPGFAFFGMQDELGELLGREVDLHTPQDLSRYFRDEVVKEAEVKYGPA